MTSDAAQFEVAQKDGQLVLVVSGDWTIHNIAGLDTDLRALRTGDAPKPNCVDVSQLGDLDTAGAYLIERSLKDQRGGAPLTLLGEHFAAKRLLTEVAKYAASCGIPAPVKPAWSEMLERIGRGVVNIYLEAVETTAFLGETILALGKSIINP
ncbi:MAG: hypothetical protein RLZZ157_1939, partial [Pseudomonadota bacterium]